MALTLLRSLDEKITATVFQGSLMYAGTNKGNLYSATTSGVVTLLKSLDAEIVSLALLPPTLYIATNRGEIYSYDIAASGAVIVANPSTIEAGLKIHTHLNVNNSGGTYDYTYINELKGEFVSTSGVMVGLGAIFQLRGTGTGSMTAIVGDALLYTGITLSGVAYPAVGTLTGGQFTADVNGTLNGTAVLVTGLYGGIGPCAGGALTVAAYVSAIWADYKSNVTLGTGISSILLLTHNGTSVVDYGILMQNNTSGTIGVGLYIPGPSVTQAIAVGTKSNDYGSGMVLPSTDDYGAVRIFSDDGGANIADSVRAFQARTLLSINQSGGSIRAIQGQMKIMAGHDVATGIYTGVQGYLELAGATTSSAGATLSCIDASLECGAVATATGEIYGVHVECTGAGSFAGAGTCAAIGITTGGTPIWPVGLYIAPLATVTAISVGTKSSTAGSGVKLQQTDDWGAVRIFTDDNGASVAKNVRALQSRTLITVAQAGGSIRTIQGQLRVLNAANFSTGVYAAVQGYIELSGSQEVTSSGILACFDASIEIGTALTATGYVAGFRAELTGAGTCAAGLDCGFLVTNAAGAAVWTYGFYAEAAAVDIGIRLAGCGTQALYANVTAVAGAGSLTGSALCIYAIGAAGQQDVGIVAYLDATATGQSTANWTYGAGIWLNLDVDWKQNLSGGWGGHEQVCPLSLGVYAPDLIGTDVNDIDVIYGIKAELVGGTAFPTTNGCYFAALNVNQTPATRTAIFFAHQGAAVGLTTAKTVAGGAIALCDVNGTMYWVNVYTA